MSASVNMAMRRKDMVEYQIKPRGIRDSRILAAMEAVPRERFVAARLRHRAYDDGPLPIGEGQTMSQPYIVALMIQALELGAAARVLEIGTGCGYAAAVLSHVAAEVYTVERNEQLAETARRNLAELGFETVHVRCGDGTLGWPEHAPFDGIVVTASGPDVPAALCAQLRIGARLVMPTGARQSEQTLVAVTRTAPSSYARQSLVPVRFVPLIGAEGWPED